MNLQHYSCSVNRCSSHLICLKPQLLGQQLQNGVAQSFPLLRQALTNRVRVHKEGANDYVARQQALQDFLLTELHFNFSFHFCCSVVLGLVFPGKI